MTTRQNQPPLSTGTGDPAWDAMVAAIGQEFGGDDIVVGDEPIEYSAVIRYCEPWEIGNLIYWDKDAAIRAGYADVVAPWSGLRQTWAYSGFWRPGQPTRFPTDITRDGNGRLGAFLPSGKLLPTPDGRQGGIVTDLEIEFFEPACVGDRISVKGKKLANVRPRQTRIGYGAFFNTVSELYNQRGQLVARFNFGMYSYVTGAQAPRQG